MLKGLLLRRPSPFVFPGGRPGFDPNNIASNPAVGFSGVATGSGFNNLLTAKPGTATGTPLWAVRDFGPTFFINNTATYYTFTNGSRKASVAVTMAAIFTPGGTDGVLIANGTAATCYSLQLASGSPDLNCYGSADNVLSAFTFTTGIPYFFAASVLVSGTIVWVVTNLKTGKILSGKATGATTATVTPGVSCLVGTNPDHLASLQNIAATMTGQYATPLPSLLQWAQDPWSFWYPRTLDLSMMLKVSAGGNVFNDSVTEAATATEADSVTATFASSDTEAATATEIDSAVAVFAASDTEAGSATDTDTASAIFAASDTEAATATDTDGGGYTVAQSEAATATETETAAAIYPVSATEAGTATDTDSAVAVFAASVTEGATATDTESTGFSDSVTETATATDAETAKVVFAASVTEAGSATDTETVATAYAVSAAEAASASETEASAAVFAASDTEAATASDSSDGALGNQVYNVNVTEAASASDSSSFSADAAYGRNRKGGGGKYSDWRKRWKQQKKIEEEDLEELIERLNAIAVDLPKPEPVIYNRPLVSAFFEQQTINKNVKTMIAKARSDADYALKLQQEEDDELAASLLLL